MSNVIHLGDVVVPIESREIMCGCGLVGWGPDTKFPARVVAIIGDEVACESAPRVFSDKISAEGVSRFRTGIGGLRAVKHAMVPIRIGQDRIRA